MSACKALILKFYFWYFCVFVVLDSLSNLFFFVNTFAELSPLSNYWFFFTAKTVKVIQRGEGKSNQILFYFCSPELRLQRGSCSSSAGLLLHPSGCFSQPPPLLTPWENQAINDKRHTDKTWRSTKCPSYGSPLHTMCQTRTRKFVQKIDLHVLTHESV